MTTFTIKPEHLRLLRAAHWRWDDSYEGAPGIDAKRPWGFSHSRLHQVAEHANLPCDNAYVEAHADELRTLWRECETVLQIGVGCGQMRPGMYRRTDDGWRWADGQADPVEVMRALIAEGRKDGADQEPEGRALLALFEVAVEAYDTDPSPVVEAVVALALAFTEMPTESG